MKTLEEMTVYIIGLGQIGGSIGMDLIRRKLVKEVLGHDKDHATMREAQERGAVHRTVDELHGGIPEADIIILAAPIRTIINQIPEVAKVLPAGAICLDVASTKKDILRAVKGLRPGIAYVSGHPIAGNEQSGIGAASADKFQGSTFVLVPNEHVSEEQARIVELLVSGLGAAPFRMSAEQHDKLVAVSSHLPYALALALSHLAGRTGGEHPALWQVIGGSFRSATRVAKSSPEFTTNLLLTNGREVTKAIDSLVRDLRRLQRILASGDESSLHQYASEARSIIDKLSE